MTKKRCICCFRYCENVKDAKAKELEVFFRGIGDYHRKPRPGVKAGCISVQHYKDEIGPDHPACDGYIHRWRWNIRAWWSWHFVPSIQDWYRQYIRVPIGATRAAVPLEWKGAFNGMADRIIPNGEPACPHCGEMPYSYEQCAFCGQRFLSDELQHDKASPQRDMRDGEPIVFVDGICPECGCSCGNGGYGPLRCRCGWVGKEISDEARKDIDELFAEEFGESEDG